MIRELQLDGKVIALANVGGKLYAINNVCLHRGGPLGEGELGGQVVTCPWHGWQYDVYDRQAGDESGGRSRDVPGRVARRRRVCGCRLVLYSE